MGLSWVILLTSAAFFAGWKLGGSYREFKLWRLIGAFAVEENNAVPEISEMSENECVACGGKGTVHDANCPFVVRRRV